MRRPVLGIDELGSLRVFLEIQTHSLTKQLCSLVFRIARLDVAARAADATHVERSSEAERF